MDHYGNIVIKLQFDDENDFAGALARVKLGDTWGFIDKTGKFVRQPSL